MAPIFKMVPSRTTPTKSSPASPLALSPPHAGRPPRIQLLRRAALRGVRGALLPAIVLPSLVALPCDVAHAHDPASNPTGHKETPVAAVPGADQPSIASTIPALGDFKKALLDRGFNLYIQDTFGNPTGGVKQGATYGSVLYMAVDADLAKIAGLSGATLRLNAYQIQGRSLSTYNIFNYSTISGFAARPTTRLFELWVEQKLFADMASIRIGQLTADNQFFISEFGNSLFINVTFGWSNLFIQDLPGGGGPNYRRRLSGLPLTGLQSVYGKSCLDQIPIRRKRGGRSDFIEDPRLI
jgi:porin